MPIGSHQILSIHIGHFNDGQTIIAYPHSLASWLAGQCYGWRMQLQYHLTIFIIVQCALRACVCVCACHMTETAWVLGCVNCAPNFKLVFRRPKNKKGKQQKLDSCAVGVRANVNTHTETDNGECEKYRGINRTIHMNHLQVSASARESDFWCMSCTDSISRHRINYKNQCETCECRTRKIGS